MNTITIKWMAFIAIALLVLGTFSPVLQVRAQADDRRRDGKGNEATEPVLTEEEAIVLALEFLRAEIGNNEFVVEKVQVDDGEYELKISDSESRYEITLDGKTGEILDFEIKTDDD
ncbi:MAG: PepSY domain-containing protein, partial [Nitrososphaerales archaeon]